MNDQTTTHFGFSQVNTEEKAAKVAEVFDSVASKYDIMNDVMSLGIHHLWKKFTIEMNDSLLGIGLVPKPGFNLGIVSSWNVTPLFKVRFLPTLSFQERHLNYSLFLTFNSTISSLKAIVTSSGE